MPKAPIIAVGGNAFELLSYLFFDRHIIGVPHPSRSNLSSHKVYRGGKVVSRQFIGAIKMELANKESQEAVNFAYSKASGRFLPKT